MPRPAESFHSSLQEISSWSHAKISPPTIKRCLRCRGPRGIVKPISDYIYQVEDLRTGAFDDIHVILLKFYQDPSLHQEPIMPHVLSFETGIIVQRLMRLVDNDEHLQV